MEPFLTNQRYAIVAMVTVSAFCASFLLSNALSTATQVAPVIVTPDAAIAPVTTVPASTVPAATPTKTVPEAKKPAAKSDDPKKNCGNGVCALPETSVLCPADCPTR